MGAEYIIMLALAVFFFMVAYRLAVKNKALVEASSVQLQLKSTRKVGEFLGHPLLELHFSNGDEEGPVWAPRSFEEHPLPWDYEANPGESSPKNSHLPAIVEFQARRPDTEFGEKEGFIAWSEGEVHFELLIDESWLLLVARVGEEQHDTPSLNFYVGEELENVEVTFSVETYQPVPPAHESLYVTAELYTEEEAQALLATIEPEVLQRIGEYCQFGGGEVIVAANEILLDVFVIGFDPEFLEDIFRESNTIARALLGREKIEDANEAW